MISNDAFGRVEEGERESLERYALSILYTGQILERRPQGTYAGFLKAPELPNPTSESYSSAQIRNSYQDEHKRVLNPISPTTGTSRSKATYAFNADFDQANS